MKLIPPDKKRCQRVRVSGSFMTLGPRREERCSNTPSYVAGLYKPTKDQPGKMSLCCACAGDVRRMMPGRVKLVSI